MHQPPPRQPSNRHRAIVTAVALSLSCLVASARTALAQEADDCAPREGFEFVCGLDNAEDLAPVPGTRWIIASRMMPGGSLVLIDAPSRSWKQVEFTAPGPVDARVFPHCAAPPEPAGFVSHGLSLRGAKDGHFTLYVVGHGGREAIEVFDVDASGETPLLTWTGCVPTPDRLEANSVVALKDGSLLATVPLDAGRSIPEAIGGSATGAVWAWSPGDVSMSRVEGTDLPYPNGIEISRDEQTFFIVTSGAATFEAFSNTRPARRLRASQPMDFVPDNLRRGPDGGLITAGLVVQDASCGNVSAAAFDLADFAACPRPFVVRSIDPDTLAMTDLVRAPRNQNFSNITVGVVVDNELWIGSFGANRVAVTALKPARMALPSDDSRKEPATRPSETDTPMAESTTAPNAPRPWVIAHRGASALRPEHTLAAYALAIEQGADAIEPDLVMTRDGVLVARHENVLSDSTDVAQRPEFAARRSRRQVDGAWREGWFSEDFSLAELKTLRARERLPQLRSTDWDGQFEVPTFEEIVALVAARSEALDRTIGLVPEIKHSSHFAALGLAMEQPLLAALAAHAYTRRAPVMIQSFETGNLRALRRTLPRGGNITLLQLLGAPDQQPYDAVLAGDPLTYAQMATPDGLRAIAGYADAVGPAYRMLQLQPRDGGDGYRSALVDAAHASGLRVIVYTFRPENHFLEPRFRNDQDPAARNEEGAVREIQAYLSAGVDGLFADDPAVARRAQ